MKLDWKFIETILSEFFATSLLICVGCLGCIESSKGEPNVIQSSIHTGFVLITILHCFAYATGAHGNPCISIALFLLEGMKLTDTLAYITIQIIAAHVGFYVLHLLIPNSFVLAEPGPCTNVPNSDLTDEQIFGIEFLLTGLLILGCCSMWCSRLYVTRQLLPMRIGIIMCTCCIAGGNLTGASLNPAKALASAVFSENYDHVYIFIAAQLSAAISIPLLWRSLSIIFS